jgi:peptidoglycan/LPS O-acetylase OafA/YrhL
MRLSSCSQGRDNNFNLIRIVAALAVLVTHSFALAIGSVYAEPFRERLGLTLGTISVDVFFITSGFLVTASLLSRQDTVEFMWARVLRVYPALVVMLLLTVFGLGVVFTSLPVVDYLSSSRTYVYFAKCATLFTGVIYDLPGVFDNTPIKNGVNGSLWTMPIEIHMYSILVMTWIVLQITKNYRLAVFQTAAVIFAIAGGVGVLVAKLYFDSEDAWLRLFFMFFTGAAFYILREYVVLSRRWFWFLVLALAVAAVNRHVFFFAYTFAISYILFYLAYVPSGWVRKYNRLGDYSYGVYIYAFPVQQAVAASIPGISVMQLMLLSGAITMLLAILSWHLLERRCLALKSRYADHTKRLIAFGPGGRPQKDKAR